MDCEFLVFSEDGWMIGWMDGWMDAREEREDRYAKNEWAFRSRRGYVSDRVDLVALFLEC